MSITVAADSGVATGRGGAALPAALAISSRSDIGLLIELGHYLLRSIDSNFDNSCNGGTAMAEPSEGPLGLIEPGQRSGSHEFSFVRRFKSSATCRFAATVRNRGIIELPAILRPGDDEHAR